ncbi:hypothetical protein TNCV_2335061 [Trichonephila clavipes]|uniref:Uncharacterized protein n=1 Tax=Trichonephila clavipes TaxID=2585209 RepID=A0A8X6SQ86_TRICX|nr:hypothetical protein TNCV_2335061 [Trichonephila clavipes]
MATLKKGETYFTFSEKNGLFDPCLRLRRFALHRFVLRMACERKLLESEATTGFFVLLGTKGKKDTLEWCMKANLIASRYECPKVKKRYEFLTRYWFGKSMNAFVVNYLKVKKNTVADWYMFCREVCMTLKSKRQRMKIDFQLKCRQGWSAFSDCFVSMSTMSQRSHLTDSEAWRVVGRLEGGQTQAEVAQAIGVS